MSETSIMPQEESHAVRIEPMDALNEKLIDNVHPPDWRNPEAKTIYNLVVVGAGTAGLVSAAIAAGLGARVALVERNLMGGDCLNVGCVPSKAIIRSSRAAYDLHHASDFGIDAPPDCSVDFSAVMERMRRLRSDISPNDSVKRFSEMGIDVFLGDARFSGPDGIEVGGQTLRFKKAIIATGARAVEPPIDGLTEAGYLTNETVFSLTEQPGEFVVIGGGPIGCELAQAFHRLGSSVTLIEASPQFLGREDSDAAEILLQQLKDEGVRVLLEAKVDSVSIEDGVKQIHINHAGQKYALSADQILVGVGRAPNVEGMNLEAAGVEYERKGVKVDDALRTTNPKIYAAGDICLPYKFTHTADFAARLAVQNALFPFLPRKKFSDLVIPWCTYTDPEIAHVGAYPRQLEDDVVSFETVKVEFSHVDRAILDGEDKGFLKVHVDAKSGRILGATVIARHAGEMLSELTLAINNKIKLGSIGNVIHPYPTQAEAIRMAADQFNRKRLTPGRRKFLQSILKLMR